MSVGPKISHDIPKRRWERVGCDLFEFDGNDYLICVDNSSQMFSKWIDFMAKLGKVIGKMKVQLARHSIPDVIISDYGAPFNCREFKDFAEKFEFEHMTSSSHYTQSNGKAENAVKIVKTLMCVLDKKDLLLALLDRRNTQSETIALPAEEGLFGRKTRTRLTLSTRNLRTNDSGEVTSKLYTRRKKTT